VGKPPVDAVIAGAQKSGTTSLLRYMSQHPQIVGQGPVETSFFFDEQEWHAGWEKAHDRYFYDQRDGRLLAKTAMLYARRICVQRLADHNPDCRIVLILRDPVERAFSSFRMEREKDWIDQPFDHVLDVLADRSDTWNRLFIQFGEYAPALRQLHEFFAPDQVKVLLYEEFVQDPVSACRETFGFLCVDDGFAPQTAVAHNVGREASSRTVVKTVNWLRRGDNPVKRVAKRTLPPRTFNRVGAAMLEATKGDVVQEQMDEHVQRELARYYAQGNRELATLLGRDLSHWTHPDD
jgi:hypothetical protein